jgi:hypothetical protein
MPREKIKIWKLEEPHKKEQFQQLLRTKLLKDVTHSVEKEWGRFETGFIEAGEEVCDQKVEGDGTDRIKEAVRRKNFMWWE